MWRAPGNVTIEKRPAQTTGIGLPLGVSPAKSAPQAPSRPFQPAPPSGRQSARCGACRAWKNCRSWPRTRSRPNPAQRPRLDFAEQKKKVGFLERLANVGRSRKEPRRRDAGQARARIRPSLGRHAQWLQAARPQPQGQSAAQRGIRIERPRNEPAPPRRPKRIEAQTRPLAVEMTEAASRITDGRRPGDSSLSAPSGQLTSVESKQSTRQTTDEH